MIVFYLKKEEETMKEMKSVSVLKDHIDYIQHTNFLEEIKEKYPGLVSVSFIECKTGLELCFEGSKIDVFNAEQQYHIFVGKIIIVELILSHEKISLLSNKAGKEFFESCLYPETKGVVLLIESKSMIKVVTQLMHEYDAVKKCFANNFRKEEISFTEDNKHILASKKWFEIFKAIDCDDLIEYNGDTSKSGCIFLHGAACVVEKYASIMRDALNEVEIIEDFLDIEPEIGDSADFIVETFSVDVDLQIADFLKEALKIDFDVIEVELKEERVKMEISPGMLMYSGTEQGIEKAKSLVMRLKDDIKTATGSFSSVEALESFFEGHCERNEKGERIEKNVKINVKNSYQDFIQQSDIENNDKECGEFLQNKSERYDNDNSNLTMEDERQM